MSSRIGKASFLGGIATLSFAAAADAQTLYRCTLPDGRTTYQDSKCEDLAKQRELSPSAAPAPAAPPDLQPSGPRVQRWGEPARTLSPVNCPTRLAPIDPRTGVEEGAYSPERRDLEMVIQVYRGYPSCAAEVPEFNARFGEAYRQWQQRYRAAIARYEANATARRMVDCVHELSAQRTAADKDRDRARNAQYCMQMLGPILQSSVPVSDR